ncbi:hypothetical protein Tco_0255624 [Tanacetum coccineum]
MGEGSSWFTSANDRGNKSDLEKVRAILRGTTPEGPEGYTLEESPARKAPEREYLNAIRLNFHASKDDMDYEALLAGLVTSAIIGKGNLE